MLNKVEMKQNAIIALIEECLIQHYPIDLIRKEIEKAGYKCLYLSNTFIKNVYLGYIEDDIYYLNTQSKKVSISQPSTMPKYEDMQFSHNPSLAKTEREFPLDITGKSSFFIHHIDKDLAYSTNYKKIRCFLAAHKDLTFVYRSVKVDYYTFLKIVRHFAPKPSKKTGKPSIEKTGTYSHLKPVEPFTSRETALNLKIGQSYQTLNAKYTILDYIPSNQTVLCMVELNSGYIDYLILEQFCLLNRTADNKYRLVYGDSRPFINLYQACRTFQEENYAI